MAAIPNEKAAGKVAPLAHEEESDRGALVNKIRQTLFSTKPEQWREFGEPFDVEKKVPSLVDRIEHIFTLPITKGTLVLRRSVPVECMFSQGKYAIKLAAVPVCTVELRAGNWDARVLVEAKRQASASGNQKIEVLAEGQIADSIFEEIRRRVTDYKRIRMADFEEEIRLLLENLGERIETSDYSTWNKSTEGKGSLLWYRTTMDGIKIAIGRQKKEGSSSYRLMFGSHDGFTKLIEGQKAQEFFARINDISERAGLRALDSLIEELAPKEDDKSGEKL